MKAQAQRLTGAVVLAFAAAAILAGSATAGSGPDAFERAVNAKLGATPAQQGAESDAFERAFDNIVQAVPARPDDLAGVRGPGIVPEQRTASPAPASSGRFHWDDAVVGAVGMGLVLGLGAALLLTIRHRGRVILP